MLTFAPLPHWPAVASATFADNAGDETIAAPWLRPGDRALCVGRASFALAALVRAWAARHDRAPYVYIPDYFCSEPLAYLSAAGARLQFYRLQNDLTPDWAACRSQPQKPDIFILVHYFGTVSAAAAARRFVDEAGALLVEDAAHMLRPEPGVGEAADVTVYAPRKWLAIPDGGVVVAPERGELFLAEIAAALGECPVAKPPVVWLAKRAVQTLPGLRAVAAWRNGNPTRFLDDPPAFAATPAVGLSSLSRRLMRTADLDQVAARRRQNKEALSRALAPLLARGDAVEIGKPRIPYRLALRCVSGDVATLVYDVLRRHRLPVESWPDLPVEVRRHPEAHARAIGLRRTVVFLPVHQTLSPDALAAEYGSVLRAI